MAQWQICWAHPSLSLETIYLQMTGRSQEEAILAEAEEA